MTTEPAQTVADGSRNPRPTETAKDTGNRRSPAPEAGARTPWWRRLLPWRRTSPPPSLKDQLEAALKAHSRTASEFSAPEKTMLLNTLRFGSLRVEDVMVPRADIIAADEQSRLDELVLLFQSAGHSRIPIYRETLDNPRGMIHLKDLVGWLAERASRAVPAGENNAQKERGRLDLAAVDLSQSIATARLSRDVLYVPPSMPVVDLLLRMQSQHIHLALVVDEYGGTDGLVSIEDLVEEIVGEIEDEHDVNGAPLIQDTDHGLLVDARVLIADMETYLGVELTRPKDEEDIDTLGGLVVAMTHRVPVRGEIVPHESGLEFEVLDADPRRIRKLKIHRRARQIPSPPHPPPTPSPQPAGPATSGEPVTAPDDSRR